ncbi:MAG TPA: phage tail protein [Trinickia sp.]|jgi:microcystin-dependent protein|nr:phage tail protein [Trinickia sp.]
MAGFLVNVTDLGRAALISADNTGTNAHRVVEIGLASAPFKASRKLTRLPHEWKRIATFAGEKISPDTIHVTLQDNTADKFTLYGFGLYLENGLLAVAYGQMKPIMEKSADAVLMLSVDIRFDSIDVATLTFGNVSFSNPPATTKRKGVIELATQEEVDQGADEARAITPKTAARRYAALTGADFQGPVSVRSQLRVNGDVELSYGSQLSLPPGSPTSPSLAFAADGAPTTGLYQSDDGALCVASDAISTVRFAAEETVFDQPVRGPAPALSDSSDRFATTSWVTATLASTFIGQIVMEARASARAGFLKLNGAVLDRSDYPALWSYAQASGVLVSEEQWHEHHQGRFSTGDGSTTFRLPDLRGEFLRCWDDGRGIDVNRPVGTWQDSHNRAHAHSASTEAAGDHSHRAWTDEQGWHGHHGWTAGVGDHQHIAPYTEQNVAPFGAHSAPHLGSRATDGDNPWAYTSGAGAHSHEFNTEGAGNHGHIVGVDNAEAHIHEVNVGADGGNEARPRNIALLAMIRAY